MGSREVESLIHARQRVDQLITGIAQAESPDAANALFDEMLEIVGSDDAVVRELVRRQDELIDEWGIARIKLAQVQAKIAAVILARGEPVAPENLEPRHERSSGPAAEIALTAFHILRHAGEIVPLDGAELELSLESPDADPDFSDYQRLYSSAVGLIASSAFYTLDPGDTAQALASEPPLQEMFPPLPFSRVWVEMRHLMPLVRVVDEELVGRNDQVDVLGIAIAEIVQGRVWDVFVPFEFGKPEFFFLAFRIAPDKAIDCDPELRLDDEVVIGFDRIRQLAVGAAHLITARNAPVESLVLPRHQRKRIVREGVLKQPSRVYFVNLSAAGEHASADGGREYHVRWLVRGHWRHMPGGRRLCTCCEPPQVASWVEPYIKGPVGAPWKGQQIRRKHGH